MFDLFGKKEAARLNKKILQQGEEIVYLANKLNAREDKLKVVEATNAQLLAQLEEANAANEHTKAALKDALKPKTRRKKRASLTQTTGYRKTTPEDRENMKTLYYQGMGVGEISHQVGFTQSTVSEWLHKMEEDGSLDPQLREGGPIHPTTEQAGE